MPGFFYGDTMAEEWLERIITPRIGVVAVVESPDRERVLVIERRFPPLGLAFPGGFMDVGETISGTAAREILEETGIVADEIGLLGVTSHPILDSRAQFVVVATVFRDPFGKEPAAGDDAKDAFWTEWRTLKPKLWDRMTERSKMEFGEYARWRAFNEAAAPVCGEWQLPRLG